ncbi:MAG: bifunctional heptose 7-phosphate kinase/heptose 1-phosphate adenyltransferase [Terriglobia bacterium]
MNKRSQHWARIVGSFRGKTVGVFGDFMLDEVLQGEATRISPEAPVPVVLIDQPPAGFPGGAGNVAANLSTLGARAIPWGAVGSDESGRRLMALLRSRNIATETLVPERGRVTPRKLRIAAHQQQLLRIDFERVSAISPASSARIERSFRRRVSELDALVVSDYLKGSIETRLCEKILSLARERRVPVFVDPKPSHPEICRHATVVTPNLREAELMAGMPMRDHAAVETGAHRLLETFECEYVLITRGAEGMTLARAGAGAHVIQSESRPVFDVTGAGDTVIAVLALAYAAGASMLDAAEIANRAAGQVVLKFGTAPIAPDELVECFP